MSKDELIEIIGNNLQQLRIQNGLTQEQLAEMVGISTSFYANVESGKRGVSLWVLYNIAQCLNVSVDYLIYENRKDARLRNIENLLADKPDSFITTIEKLINLCVEDFQTKNDGIDGE